MTTPATGPTVPATPSHANAAAAMVDLAQPEKPTARPPEQKTPAVPAKPTLNTAPPPVWGVMRTRWLSQLVERSIEQNVRACRDWATLVAATQHAVEDSLNVVAGGLQQVLKCKRLDEASSTAMKAGERALNRWQENGQKLVEQSIDCATRQAQANADVATSVWRQN